MGGPYLNVEGVSGGCGHRATLGWTFALSDYFSAEEQNAYRVGNKILQQMDHLPSPDYLPRHALSPRLPPFLTFLYPVRTTTTHPSLILWPPTIPSKSTPHLAFSKLLLLVSELMVLLRVKRSVSS